MVSLKDVAKRCGVSTATVSKALNGHSDIGEKTRIRIKEAAQEMGYFPNAAARALKTNRSYNLGVLFKEEAGRGLNHEYFSGILNGFKEKAEELGYDITFINNEHVKHKMSYLEHCKYRNFDGVGIVCARFEEPEVQELLQSNIPIVTVDYVYHNCTVISSNNVKGMNELVRYIYSKGHRKIAYIYGEKHSAVTRDRLTSFFQTMESFNLNVPDDYLKEGEYLDTRLVAKATRELLNLPDPPTCILYPDDTALIGGINVIDEMGLKVPDDISIAGFDGTKVSQMMSPKITTIRQNTRKIGEEAVKRLVQRIEQPKTTLVERVIINGELLVGESVGGI